MNRIFIIMLSFFFVPVVAGAKKKVTVKTRFKEAYAALKSSSGQDAAARTLADSLSVVSLSPAQKADGYYLCARLMDNENNAINMKAYLKEGIDTARFYQTVYNIFSYSMECNKVDAKSKYENKITSLRAKHGNNLLSGGLRLMQQKKYDEAFKYFDLYIASGVGHDETRMGKAAYWATFCGINANNPTNVLKHIQQAMGVSDADTRAKLAECQARSLVAINDTTQWVTMLESGVRDYPGSSYFYNHLIDWYIKHEQYGRGMALTDSLISYEQDRIIYWESKSLIALAMHDYQRCIELSDVCLKRDADNLNALYNKGAAYLDMALNEKDKAMRTLYYSRALDPMERLRRLQPDAVTRWGSALYRIYLNLNMGEKFDEIDKLLSNY